MVGCCFRCFEWFNRHSGRAYDAWPMPCVAACVHVGLLVNVRACTFALVLFPCLVACQLAHLHVVTKACLTPRIWGTGDGWELCRKGHLDEHMGQDSAELCHTQEALGFTQSGEARVCRVNEQASNCEEHKAQPLTIADSSERVMA